jgi:hypothetical protein
MKGNMKKLAVLMMIAAIAMFIAAATASAGRPIVHGITGRYATTGTSYCITAFTGFTVNADKTLTPNDGWSSGPSILDAVFTFHNDGTGSAQGLFRGLTLPPGGETPSGYGEMDFSYQFTYTVTNDGFITFTIAPHTYYKYAGGAVCFDAVPRDGAISGDGKTITIACGPPLLMDMVDCGTGAPLGPQVMCIASWVMVRLEPGNPRGQ